ncbi:hypothetical protein C8R43DRAFT_1046725 [Mycena crocata]|nr:hypothetical protein C8R43DRAFT_1046725 [Mycena crocata]
MDERNYRSGVLVGFCRLPGGVVSETQMWTLLLDPPGPLTIDTYALPPDFDLHRYITHVNRGITHFHASFWPLPRKISDAELDAAAPSKEWMTYARQHHMGLSGLKGQGVIGIQKPDGTRVPLYKYSQNGHFRRCAPGETDMEGPEEFKKLPVDPSRMVRMISECLRGFR